MGILVGTHIVGTLYISFLGATSWTSLTCRGWTGVPAVWIPLLSANTAQTINNSWHWASSTTTTHFSSHPAYSTLNKPQRKQPTFFQFGRTQGRWMRRGDPGRGRPTWYVAKHNLPQPPLTHPNNRSKEGASATSSHFPLMLSCLTASAFSFAGNHNQRRLRILPPHLLP